MAADVSIVPALLKRRRAIKVAYWSSDLKDSAAKEKKKLLL